MLYGHILHEWAEPAGTVVICDDGRRGRLHIHVCVGRAHTNGRPEGSYYDFIPPNHSWRAAEEMLRDAGFRRFPWHRR